MKSGDLKKRTKQFALDILNLTDSILYGRKADAICRQLIRSATSVGARTSK
ncbi:MAG TPA: four helix bundle protein [Bacteroidota bacterium]